VVARGFSPELPRDTVTGFFGHDPNLVTTKYRIFFVDFDVGT